MVTGLYAAPSKGGSFWPGGGGGGGKQRGVLLTRGDPHVQKSQTSAKHNTGNVCGLIVKPMCGLMVIIATTAPPNSSKLPLFLQLWQIIPFTYEPNLSWKQLHYPSTADTKRVTVAKINSNVTHWCISKVPGTFSISWNEDQQHLFFHDCQIMCMISRGMTSLVSLWRVQGF